MVVAGQKRFLLLNRNYDFPSFTKYFGTPNEVVTCFNPEVGRVIPVAADHDVLLGQTDDSVLVGVREI